MRDTLGVRGREEQRDRAAVPLAEQSGTLTPGRVEHSADVVGAFLEVRHVLRRHRVGEADSALVEHHQAREGREAAEEVCDRRLLPVHVEMRDPAGHVDKVHGPVADDLVGDVVVAALRVPRLRTIHCASILRVGRAPATLTIPSPNVERREGAIDSVEELGLLRVRRDGHTHASLRQAYVGHDPVRLVVEVQELPAVALELRRPNLAKRRMGAKLLEERSDPVERRLSHFRPLPPQAPAAARGGTRPCTTPRPPPPARASPSRSPRRQRRRPPGRGRRASRPA